MLERLRMQEVKQIILSVPEGVSIPGTQLSTGEPVIIINKPATSTLSFVTNGKKNNDESFMSASGLTKTIDFTINDGAILYSVWSYIHGIIEDNTNSILKGTEHLHADSEHKILLSAHTNIYNLVVYRYDDNGNLIKLIPTQDYIAYYEEEEEIKNYYIEIYNNFNDEYFICYDYEIADVLVTKIKQIHNNIFCTLDMYFEAVDMITDDKHTVCLHCDKVQIFTDLAIGINNSQKASFTPITIHSVPNSNDFNKTVATLTVV